MNDDLKDLAAVLRQLGWSDELIASIEEELPAAAPGPFGDVCREYINPWRVISSSGANLKFLPPSSASSPEFNPMK
jgi:hypothetical protein